MPITLDSVAPWGRSYDEYLAMFDLPAQELTGRILGCGDGPASFNSEATERGVRVVSCDPLYRFSAADIERRIQATYQTIIDQLRRDPNGFVWTTFSSPDQLGQVRLAAMQRFLKDYPQGRVEGRYLCAGLPSLPFGSRQFDLALCSHFLFLYSDQLSLAFHLAALREMCRLAREVRIFPLLDMACRESVHLRPIVSTLQRQGYDVAILPVPYEFQREGNRMLRMRCPIQAANNVKEVSCD